MEKLEETINKPRNPEEFLDRGPIQKTVDRAVGIFDKNFKNSAAELLKQNI